MGPEAASICPHNALQGGQVPVTEFLEADDFDVWGAPSGQQNGHLSRVGPTNPARKGVAIKDQIAAFREKSGREPSAD